MCADDPKDCLFSTKEIWKEYEFFDGAWHFLGNPDEAKPRTITPDVYRPGAPVYETMIVEEASRAWKAKGCNYEIVSGDMAATGSPRLKDTPERSRRIITPARKKLTCCWWAVRRWAEAGEEVELWVWSRPMVRAADWSAFDHGGRHGGSVA